MNTTKYKRVYIMLSQQNVIVANIKKRGILSRQSFIDFCIARGQVMDQGLVHARIKDINDRPEKFGIHKGTKIGRVLVKDIDHKINHLYMFVDEEEWIQPEATDCTKFLFDSTDVRTVA